MISCGWQTVVVEPTYVYLPDSFVVEVASTGSEVCFLIEAALEREHPLFYWPPKQGEANAYAVLWWCLTGGVRWVEGPNAPGPPGPDGQRDYGSIDEWGHEADTWRVQGGFGHVVVEDGASTVRFRSRDS